MPQVCIPDRLHHPAVESAGQQGDYSAQRKHPVFFVDLPSHTLSMTIGWLDPGQSSNMHRHTYETILYVLEGSGGRKSRGAESTGTSAMPFTFPFGPGTGTPTPARAGHATWPAKMPRCCKTLAASRLREEAKKSAMVRRQGGQIMTGTFRFTASSPTHQSLDASGTIDLEKLEETCPPPGRLRRTGIAPLGSAGILPYLSDEEREGVAETTVKPWRGAFPRSSGFRRSPPSGQYITPDSPSGQEPRRSCSSRCLTGS